MKIDWSSDWILRIVLAIIAIGSIVLIDSILMEWELPRVVEVISIFILFNVLGVVTYVFWEL